MRATVRFRRWMFPLLLTAAVLPGAGSARGGELGTCYVATIPESFVIEDGGTYPAGRLRICESARFSPVETLHVIYVDGMPEGAFRARVTTTMDRSLADGSSVFLFSRGVSGGLLLEGYSYRQGARERTFVMGSSHRRNPRAPGPQGAVPSPVVIAASRNS